jgi:hypothetical protein
MIRYQLNENRVYPHSLGVVYTGDMMADTANHWRLSFLVEHFDLTKRFLGSYEYVDNNRLTTDAPAEWNFELKEDAFLIKLAFEPFAG